MGQLFNYALVGEKNNSNEFLGTYTLIETTNPNYDGVFNNEVEIILANDTQKQIMMEKYSVDVEYAIQSGPKSYETLFSALFNEGRTNIYCGRNTKGALRN